MHANEIQDVLNVSGTLEAHNYSDAAHTPGLIADLINWADQRADQRQADHKYMEAGKVDDTPKTKRGKAKAETPDDTFEASPDPSADEPDF